MIAYSVIMKRVVSSAAIIAGLLVVAWFVLGYVKRTRQNNASVAMFVVTEHLKKHVRVKSEWPRSWEELYPEGMADEQWVSRLVTVNWQATLEEITNFVDRVDINERKALFPRDIDLSFLVGFTDRVPRDEGLAVGERLSNWAIATSIYMERQAQSKEGG